MMDNLEQLSKLTRIINLSIDINENQKMEWLQIIESIKNAKDVNLSILANEITRLDINAYNAIFQKKVNGLSKRDIVQYTTLALDYLENRNIDSALAFLENFNNKIQKINPSSIKRIQKLQRKKGIISARQRSFELAKNPDFSSKIVAKM